MTQLETTELGTLEEPVPIPSLPFAQTIDVSGRTARPNEPSPCLPSAASVWYALPRVASAPSSSTWRAAPHPTPSCGSIGRDPRQGGHVPRLREPVWNARLALEVAVAADESCSPRSARRSRARAARRARRAARSTPAVRPRAWHRTPARPSRCCSASVVQPLRLHRTSPEDDQRTVSGAVTVRRWPGRGVRVGPGGSDMRKWDDRADAIVLGGALAAASVLLPGTGMANATEKRRSTTVAGPVLIRPTSSRGRWAT